MEDIEAIETHKVDEVIDRTEEVRRERIAMRSKQEINIGQIKAVYFDGKRDNTLTISQNDDKSYKKNIVEEHISLVSEPVQNTLVISHFNQANTNISTFHDPVVEGGNVRNFSLPKLNFQCEDYVNMINWHECTVSEPPLISIISTEELENFI